jgi:hypothetical protein
MRRFIASVVRLILLEDGRDMWEQVDELPANGAEDDVGNFKLFVDSASRQFHSVLPSLLYILHKLFPFAGA